MESHHREVHKGLPRSASSGPIPPQTLNPSSQRCASRPTVPTACAGTTAGRQDRPLPPPSSPFGCLLEKWDPEFQPRNVTVSSCTSTERDGGHDERKEGSKTARCGTREERFEATPVRVPWAVSLCLCRALC